MKTYFATAERVEDDTIQKCVSALGLNKLISGIMVASGGILAILNEQRQILAVNHAFLRELGVQDAETTLGLRLGEVLGCVHSNEMRGGCGTSKWCSTCGAAVAMVTALAGRGPHECKCVITVQKIDAETPLCLAVRACLIDGDDSSYILLYMQDISKSERRAALERVFIHDLKNVAMGIGLGVQLLESLEHTAEAKTTITHFAQRIQSELLIHAALCNSESKDYQPLLEPTTTKKVIDRLSLDFEPYTARLKKKFTVPCEYPVVSFNTDLTLLFRVLGNMATNALEATSKEGEIKLFLDVFDSSLTFTIWNNKAINPSVCLRIFQQYFTTKEGAGRGLGTFSMKLLGEQYLGGKVSFKTSESEGTSFSINLPRELAKTNSPQETN